MVYRDGVYKVENLEGKIYLFYDNEDATGMETGQALLTKSEDIESYANAEIKMVKAERGATIKELEEDDWKEQEGMIEHMWENPDMQQAEWWDGVDSLEEAKAKFKRVSFGEEAEES